VKRLRTPRTISRGARYLVMLAVMGIFCGIYALVGPAGAQTADSDAAAEAPPTTAAAFTPGPAGENIGVAPSAIASEAKAEDGSVSVDGLANAVEKNRVSINLTWMIVAGALVFFMQAGFAMVETGFCRAKHAAHVVMTNYMVFGIAALAFAAIGYSFMFGNVAAIPNIGLQTFGEPLLKVGDWQFLSQGGWFLGGSSYDSSVLAFFFFQLVFMDTMATIPTGAMAERWKFSAFAVFAVFAGAVIYPIVGNWVWGNGWLANLGVNSNGALGVGAVDFAGSGVVHAVGGITGLMGAIVLGPRIGKFNKDGSPNAMPAHNIPMGLFGTIILFFGWIGFNGGSTFAASDGRFPVVIVNTILAGSAGAVVALAVVKSKFGKFDPSMAANGGLAGLVAITAPCAFTNPKWSMVIGGAAGLIMVYSVLFVERRKVDDPVGAVSVHGVCGIFGILAVGIFADGTYSAGMGADGLPAPVKGLITGETGQFFAQLIYAAALIVFISVLTYVFFKIQDKVQGIRSDEADEIQGLDIPEMGVEAYPRELEVSPGVYAGTSIPRGSHTVTTEPAG